MKIKIYTAPHCLYSKQAKSLLESRSICYEECDVVENAEAYRAMLALSHQSSVPVIDTGGDVFVGFDRKKLMRLLNLNRNDWFSRLKKILTSEV